MLKRIIDANLNRCSEAIRVVEDYCRFVINDKTKTKKLKGMRHEISSHFKDSDFILFRDIGRDAGKFLNTTAEFKRNNIGEIIRSNCKRTGESARVLEEYLKLEDKKGALIFKKIRFKIYAIEKELVQNIMKNNNS